MTEQHDWSKPPVSPIPQLTAPPSGMPSYRYYSASIVIYFMAGVCFVFLLAFFGALRTSGGSLSILGIQPLLFFIPLRRRLWLYFADIDRYPKDEKLTQRLNELVPANNIEVHVDYSSQGQEQLYSIRNGRSLLVSAHLISSLPPPETEYLLVRTALNNKAILLRNLMAVWVCLAAICWLPFLIEMITLAILLLICIGIIWFAIAARSDKALKITRDLNAALATAPILTVIDTGFTNEGQTQMFRSRLIEAARKLGLPPPSWENPISLYQ